MKILIICDRLSTRGGLETHVLSQVNGLLECGHEVMLNVNAITEYNLSLVKNKDKFHLRCPWLFPWDRVMEDIDGFVPDVIHCHPFSAIDRGKIVAQHLKIPFFVTMHGFYGYPLDNIDTAQYVTKVFAVDHGCEKIIKHSTSCGNRLDVIYNSIDLEEFYSYQPSNELYSSLHINKNWKTLGIITRFDDGKEIPALQTTRILTQLADKLGGLNVLYVGGGRKVDDIKNNIPNVENLNIQVVGEVTNVADYMNMCDFICASARTAIEAIACGKNVFQMGISQWGVLVDKNNYKDTLFDKTYYTNYTDDQLLNHLHWFLTQDLSDVTIGLVDIIRKECDINYMINKLEEYYKGELL